MPRLKAILWRAAYVVIGVLLLMIIGPPLLALLGLSTVAGGQAWVLLKVIFGILALLFIVFGPEPPTLF